MDVIALNATKRTVTGKQVGQLRQQGKLPAVLYGLGLVALLTLDRRLAGSVTQFTLAREHDQAVARYARRIIVLHDGLVSEDTTDFARAMQALHASEFLDLPPA